MQDKAIRSWLETTADWLLVFDNVTEEGYRAILELLPQGAPQGDILFTSQRPGAMDRLTGNLKTRCLRLEELTSDDSVDLFHLVANISRTANSERDAKEIVKSNGFLPQAVHQAASYIKNTGISLPDYMSQFKRNTDKVYCLIALASLSVGANWFSCSSTRMHGIIAKQYLFTCRSV